MPATTACVAEFLLQKNWAVEYIALSDKFDSITHVADDDIVNEDDMATEVQTNFVSSQNYTSIITTKLNNK